MLESRIYVGLHDKDSHEQLYDTETYKSILKDICRNHQAPFSLQVIEGGYYHDDGSLVEENTLLVTLIGVKELCTCFRQESVMITGNPVLSFSVQDDPNLFPDTDDDEVR